MTMNVQAMTRTPGLVLLGLAVGFATASCVQQTSFVNLDHCANQNGNDWCAERYGGEDQPRPYCILGNGLCGSTPGQDGCVSDEPVDGECYSPCGDSQPATENSACLGMESTDGTTSTGETTDDPTGSESSTTGPEPCVGNENCPDAAAPLCEPVSGECITCDAFGGEGDAACAGLDPMAPLCVNGACVACTPENPVVCDDQLLLCDGGTNTCIQCTEHAQCGSGACELSVGRCFPEDFVVHVDGDAGAMPVPDYTSISAAVDAVDDGTHGVIIVHEQDGQTPYTTAGMGLRVDGGKTIALLAAPGEGPIIQGTNMNPGLRVEGAGTIVYMDGLRLRNGDVQGLVVDGAFAWVDRSRIVDNTGGGVLAQNAAELTLRNCFVGGDVSDANALEVDGATTSVEYTTLGAGTVTAVGLSCTAPLSVVVRNSLIVARGVDATGAYDLVCDEADVTYSATEAAVGGLGNEAVGEMDSTMPQLWFVGYGTGDFHLQNDGLTLFADVAQWQTGDPLTDIDGDPRPTVDGTADFAGADAVP